MQLTIFSFFSATLWSSFLFIILYWIRKLDKPKRYFGLLSIMLLYGLIVCRMVLPLELNHAVILQSENVYPSIFHFLYGRSMFGHSILTLLILVWVVVASILLVHHMISYCKVSKQLIRNAVPCGDYEQHILQNIKRTAGTSIHVSLVKSSDINVPMGFGVHRKLIVLPDYKYDDGELRYILLHEYTHFVNHDIIIKFALLLFCIIFWWNPLVYLCKNDLEHVLEMRCDRTAVKTCSAQQKAEYLHTIVKAFKRMAQGGYVPCVSATFLMNTQSDYIKERFDTVMYDRQTAKSKVFSTILAFLLIATITVSYAFILQPSIEAPEISNGMQTFDTSNAYILHTKGGEYNLCIQGIPQRSLSAKEIEFFTKEGFTFKEE